MKKIIIIIISLVSIVGYNFYDKISWFAIEDSIHDNYYPVLNAIFDYLDQNSKPPNNLNDLIPKFIKKIPELKYADKVSYKIIDDKNNWEFIIESNAREKKRKYICRSNKNFSDKEKENIILEYHAYWTVLEYK